MPLPARRPSRLHVQAARDRGQRRVRRGRHEVGDRDAVRGAATSSYRGKVVLLDDPLEMADPKKAFTENPYAEADVDLTFTGQGRASMFGGEPDEPHETPGEEFAKGHYEQLVAGSGRSGSASESGTSTGSASATTRGGRATGRHRGTTAGSPPTSVATSGSWAAGSRGATAEGTRGGFVWEDGKLHLLRLARAEDHVRGRRELPRDDLGRAAIIADLTRSGGSAGA